MRYFPRHLAAEANQPEPSNQGFWEEVHCPLCGSGRSVPLVEASDWAGGSGMVFGVAQCVDCTLAYTNPRPAEACLGRFYTHLYPPHQMRIAKPRTWSRWLRLAQDSWRPPFAWHGDGRLLDFGCGAGYFIQRMDGWHWKVTGIDLSETVVRRARQATGLHILAGTLPHDDLAPNSFDVITMRHSLEHVPDPMRTLQEARKLLTWDGKLVIGVPNLGGLGFRVFGPHWAGLDLPRHLTHFTPWTLQLMLERAGYRLESLRMDPRSSWLRRSAAEVRRSGGERHIQRWLGAKLPSRLAASYSRLARQADALVVAARPVDRP